MAKVMLPFASYKEVVPLPPVCMRCGKPATRTEKMSYAGRTTRVMGIRVFAPGGKYDYVVVNTPLCDGHPFLGAWGWFIFGGMLILLIGIGATAGFAPYLHPVVCAFPLLAMTVMFAPLFIYSFFVSIGSEGFDEDGVYLYGVSSDFIKAMKARKWTRQEFVAEIRKNSQAREKPQLPFVLKPWFIVPAGVMLAFGCCTPVGFLTACVQNEGPWPAGLFLNRRQNPGKSGQTVQGPNVPGPVDANPPPPVDANPPPPVDRNPPPPDVHRPPPDPPKQLEPFNPKSINGLIGYWPMDEGQGQAVQDTSGNGVLALCHGGDWVDGVRGKALRFNGKDEYLDMGVGGKHLNFAAGAPFTVACWVNTTADTGVIFSFRHRADMTKGAVFPVISLRVMEGKVSGWVRDDNSGMGAAKPVGGSVKDGKWHHVALVRQPDGTVELYLDGTFQAKDKGPNSGGAITTQLHAVGSDRFVVDAKQDLPSYFAGSVDEFCVFNQALTADKIVILMGGKK